MVLALMLVTTVGIFNSFPWAMFGTGANGTALLARVATGGPLLIILPWKLSDTTSHIYRIEWLATGFNFYIDGSSGAL